MNFKKIEVITVAKVGSSDFLHSCKKIHPTKHKHSLLRLRKIVNNHTDTLIIVGIRNPIDRNLSYFFQSYDYEFYNNVKTKVNNYKGEYNYINKFVKTKIKNISTEEIIQRYFNMPFHNTFNDWFMEFFEITSIDKKRFNIDKGLDFYSLSNNNTIMIYTLEKLNDNKDEICSLLKIPFLLHSNNSNNRHYKDIYNNVKKNIVYKKEYLDKLLNTDIIRFFYSETDIKAMYDKYITF